MENVSQKPKHKYADLFSVLKKAFNNYSNKIIKYEEMKEEGLKKLACSNKARIVKLQNYLHERAMR